jgi:hypothetical protein
MRSFVRLTCILGLGLMAVLLPAKVKQTVAQGSANVHFTVLKDDNNKPVRNASVILHLVNKKGGQAKGGFQLKTDNEGVTGTEGIPYGMIRIQVLAPGFQTFGDDYQIDKPAMDIQIRLKRPSDQMSVYDKPQAKPQTPPATPPAEPKPN